MTIIKEMIKSASYNQINVDEILKQYSFEEIAKEYEETKKMITNYSYRTKHWNSYREQRDCYILLKQIYDAACKRNEANELEKELNESNSIDLDMSWDNNDTNDDEHVDNVYDGLVLSLANKAKVDIGYISKVTGVSKKDVVENLKGVIYQNPATFNNQEYEGYETSDEYLSGNMYTKLDEAFKANYQYSGRFLDNIKAIKEVYPDLTNESDIYITLGSPWIPTDIIDEFIVHLLGESEADDRKKHITRHDLISGTWETANNGRYFTSNAAYSRVWGTKRCSALRILENSLNMKKCFIYDTVYGTKDKKLNVEETTLVQEKQRLMIEEFKKWIWSDNKRKQRLLQIYEEKYGSFVKRKYDGSFLRLDDMNNAVKLYDYQKNAIARILFSKNVLLAHDVGSGKTYEMVVAGHELKRIGLSKKNLYVVPNNIVRQWYDSYSYLYPYAKVLTIEPKDFTPKKRDKTLNEIINEDYEAIIMAYSCFDSIPLSRVTQIENLTKEKLDIVKSQSFVTSGTNVIDKRKERINQRIIELKIDQSEEGICFEDLKINRLFIDEAHNYKNVPIATKMNNCLGINASGSKKCKDMLDKVHYIQSRNNGGGVVMATGTPITNSICEVYNIQKFLQNGELKLLELESFDSWAGMFSETKSDFEIDVATNSYRYITRFSKFHNLVELTNLLSLIADFHEIDKNDDIPLFDGYVDTKIKKSKELDEILKDISWRADVVRKHLVNSKNDNMLKITTDGRKAALDLRLLDDDKYELNNESKVVKCALNILKEYNLGSDEKTSQLVFCDSSTPKNGFNMYDELKRILIRLGIPEIEIAYIHDATNDKQRSELYEKVRRGEIRVLIGSTFKLGIGVNVQDKLCALHHLDIPWRPADMVQREGRILRQGNQNEKVNIYRYVTEGSFDAYSWQLLEIKQQFINDLLSSSLDKRDGDDISDSVLSYSEIKALAIGNPLIKERVEVINELSRLKLLHNKIVANKLDMEKELLNLPKTINIQEHLIDNATKDYEYLKTVRVETDKEKRKYIKSLLTDSVIRNVLLPNERSLIDYCGMNIKLPKNMSKEKPYIIIENYGRYELEMGDSENGNLIRLDNFIASFDKLLKGYKQKLIDIKNRSVLLKEELFKNDDTIDQIKLLQEKLIKIEERLELTYE